MDIEEVVRVMLKAKGKQRIFNAKLIVRFLDIDTLSECKTASFIEIYGICEGFAGHYGWDKASRMWRAAEKEERLGLLLAGFVTYMESEAY